MIAAGLADLGPWPYYGGAVLVIIGLQLLVEQTLRRPVAPALLATTGAVLAVAVGTSPWVGLHGLPRGHDHWPDDVAGTVGPGGAGRDGVWFTGSAALDRATGATLWTTWGDGEPPTSTQDAGVLAFTESTVVSREGDEVVAKDLSDGTEQWSTTTGGTRATAIDGDVLVTTSRSGTVALDLRTGQHVWSSPDDAVRGCASGRVDESWGAAPTQGLVLLIPQDSDGHLQTGRARGARVSDGEVVAEDLTCYGSVATIGDALIHRGRTGSDVDRLFARSGDDGRVLWRMPPWGPHRAQSVTGWAGSSLYITTRTDPMSGAVTTVTGVDMRTGHVDVVRPPSGWSAHESSPVGRGRPVRLAARPASLRGEGHVGGRHRPRCRDPRGIAGARGTAGHPRRLDQGDPPR